MFKSEWLKRQDILLSFVANSFAAKVLVIVNKIILFWFLFINSGRYNNKKTEDYQERHPYQLLSTLYVVWKSVSDCLMIVWCENEVRINNL